MLITISGPIASGKSTVARELAQLLEQRGETVAVVDLDLVYEMLEHHGAEKASRETWRLARRTAARLAAALTTDVSTVIVEGDFRSAAKWAEFLDAYDSPDGEPVFVALRASFEQTLARATGDLSRGLSRDPAILRGHYDDPENSGVPEPGALVFDTDSMTAEAVAQAIAHRL